MVLIDEPPATFCANAHSRILLIAPLCARVRLSSYLRSAFHILHARPDVSQSNKEPEMTDISESQQCPIKEENDTEEHEERPEGRKSNANFCKSH